MAEGAARVTEAITAGPGLALCAYLTAGYPDPAAFREILPALAAAADVVEIGVPFTDPMADGLTIQRASQVALDYGVTLGSILTLLAETPLDAPVLLMGYYNPFLAYGLERLAESMTETGTTGLIVPDLPLEESGDLFHTLETRGLALVRLVAPTTPPARMRVLAESSRGFVYAVNATGTTGKAADFDEATLDYLDRVSSVSPIPVLAGFGIRDRSQVATLSGHVDGVVVGSALIEEIDRGGDPAAFIAGLRPEAAGQ
ncbi:MAG: tryptophan synthase subunit alpha [Actinobacteria bacterium]|nr:tryptophan synthase subunit alpha [Actinomycetota bacterium]